MFTENGIVLHGLPGGRLQLAVGHSAGLHHEHYVVQIQVVTHDQAKAAPRDLMAVHEYRDESGTRVTWGGPP
jgi:hypothetical protein